MYVGRTIDGLLVISTYLSVSTSHFDTEDRGIGKVSQEDIYRLKDENLTGSDGI